MGEREEEHLALISDVIDGGGDQVGIADYLWKRGYRIAKPVYILESIEWDPACGCAHMDSLGAFQSLDEAKREVSQFRWGEPYGSDPERFMITELTPPNWGATAYAADVTRGTYPGAIRTVGEWREVR